MTQVERTLASLEKERYRNLGKYDIVANEIKAILAKNSHDVCGFGYDMFLVGFIRGCRCGEVTQKKQKGIKACGAKH